MIGGTNAGGSGGAKVIDELGNKVKAKSIIVEGDIQPWKQQVPPPYVNETTIESIAVIPPYKYFGGTSTREIFKQARNGIFTEIAAPYAGTSTSSGMSKVFACKKELHLVGGTTPYQSHWALRDEQWVKLKDTPYSTIYCSTVVERADYVLFIATYQSVSKIIKYNIIDDSWVDVVNAPDGIKFICEYDGHIYVSNETKIYKLNDDNTFTEIATMIFGQSGDGAMPFVINNVLYYLSTFSGNYYYRVYRFDGSTFQLYKTTNGANIQLGVPKTLDMLDYSVSIFSDYIIYNSHNPKYTSIFNYAIKEITQ